MLVGPVVLVGGVGLVGCVMPFAEGGGGVIVATTHLFWHPKYAYERVRQAAILMQELEAFRSDPEHADVASWPAILAGDLALSAAIRAVAVGNESGTPADDGGRA